MFVTNKDLTIKHGVCMELFIPKGSKVDYIHAVFFLSHSAVPKENAIARHDATYTGIRIDEKDIETVTL